MFENSIENSLFYFNEDGVYTAVDNLQPGNGYWLRFELPYNTNISGQVINSLTVNLVEGWNLISGISNCKKSKYNLSLQVMYSQVLFFK